MATSCEDVNARLVELLYEELPAEERTALEGHVAGCASCRAELDGFNQTRKLARQVIDEPVPRRAHAAIMNAAAEHLTQQEQQRAKAPARESATQRTSFWEWIRTRWTLPTLATVGAVAVFLLASKVFMDPKRTYERGREIAGGESTTAPTTPPSAAPASPQPPAEKSAAHHAPAPEAEPDEGTLAGSKLGGGSAKDVAAGKPASSSSGAGFGSGAGATASKPVRGKRSRDAAESVDRLLGLATEPADKAASPRRQFAPPPPPPKAPAAAKPAKVWVADKEAPLAKAAKEAKPADDRKQEIAQQEAARRDIPAQSAAEEESDMGEGRATRTLRGSESGSPAGPREATAAPAAAPPPPAPVSATVSRAEAEKKSVSKKKDAPAQASRPAPAPAADSLLSGTSSKGAKGGGSAAAVSETPVQRADRLFTQGRWLAAAEAYRELLRQDPRNPDAARWRQRATLAETRLEAEREAPASAPAK